MNSVSSHFSTDLRPGSHHSAQQRPCDTKTGNFTHVIALSLVPTRGFTETPSLVSCSRCHVDYHRLGELQNCPQLIPCTVVHLNLTGDGSYPLAVEMSEIVQYLTRHWSCSQLGFVAVRSFLLYLVHMPQ